MTGRCAFCRIASGELPAQVVHRDTQVLAFLDANPLLLGHVLVIPIAHVDALDGLPAELTAPVFDVVRRMSVAVQRALGADGSFVAVNTRVSQSVPHLHVHVVPRTGNDGLFSPRPIWKRRAYAGEREAAEYAEKIRIAYAVVAADR